MADISHRLPDVTDRSWPSRYARMIPGNAATASPANGPSHLRLKPVAYPSWIPEPARRTSGEQSWTRILLPRNLSSLTTARYNIVFVDFLTLLAASLISSVCVPAWSVPRPAMPAYAVLVILLAFSEGLYRTDGSPLREQFPVLARSAAFAMGLVLIAVWNHMQPVGALTAWLASLVGLLVSRLVRKEKWAGRFRRNEPRNVLIVGAGHTARAIARGLRDDPSHAVNVAGFLDDHVPRSPQVLGRIADLDWLARAQFIDEVILALPNDPALSGEAAERAFRNHLDIRAVPNLPPGRWPSAGVERIGGIPVIALHRESLPRLSLLLKRVLDLVGASAGLLLLAPLMGMLAVLIRLDSQGPILYAAERTGVKGRRFRCYKFRSMAAGADQMKETLRKRNQREGPIFKIVDDPRITRLGRFLRRYSLDELPQLWNVLRGEMSLVGPRPHPVDEVNQYQLEYYRRLDMKPGITGLWQITARSSPSFDLNMHLDLTYIENWTIALDLWILFSTARVLFAPEGA